MKEMSNITQQMLPVNPNVTHQTLLVNPNVTHQTLPVNPNVTHQILPTNPSMDNSQIVHIPKSKEQLVHENSSQAYIKVRKDVEDFKAQYKKPPECYDIKDDATRIHCANEFIRARQAYEASNK